MSCNNYVYDLTRINYYYYSALSNRQMEFISEEETALNIMKKLDSMYLRESTALQICVRNKIEKLKLKDFEESVEFFSMFEKLIIELRNAGAKVSEKKKLNYLLRTLPSSFSYIADLIDVLKEEDQTVDFVKNKIKMFEEKENEEDTKTKGRYGNASAFKAERKKEKTCFKCNGIGHFQYDCPQNQSSSNSWRGNFRGQNGNPRGNRGQPRQGGVRGRSFTQRGNFNNGYRGRYNSYQRGRGGTWQQQHERQENGSNEGNYMGNAFCTEANYSTGNNIEVNNSEKSRIVGF